MTALLRLAVEAGPLLVFLVVNGRGGLPELHILFGVAGDHAQQGLFDATAALMAATLAAIVTGYAAERRLPLLPLVSGFFVVVLGGLTLVLADELIIKLKPTIVNTLFATALLGGLAFGRSLLKPLLGAAFEMDDPGWRALTLRWGLFFVLLAVLNEIVWRLFETETWIAFKLFGILPLTVIFALSQTPLLLRHRQDGGGSTESR
ncbi:MAG: septation protein A [Alphaproteobacteria bacterium]|nr:septation protein A [Alphaproteobacteria bacterium]